MKPVMTEKAVMMIERDNVITFVVSKIKEKTEIKKEIEETFDVQVDKIRTLIKDNKKYVYAKLKGETLAIDIAGKLGLM